MTSPEVSNGQSNAHSNGHHGHRNGNSLNDHGTYIDGEIQRKPTFPLSRSVRQKARRYVRNDKAAPEQVGRFQVLGNAVMGLIEHVS